MLLREPEPTPLAYVIAIIYFAGPLVLFVVLLVRWVNRRPAREARGRGFEVKLNTGETPVPREQQKSHG